MKVTKDKIEEAKKPKTRKDETQILEGEPNVNESWNNAYKSIAEFYNPWLLRYYYHQLYMKMLCHDRDDELFGHQTLLSNLKCFLQGIATYADRYPNRIPDLCAAMAGVVTLKESTDMTAKQARKHIRNTSLGDLEGFLSEGEERATVLDAWENKHEIKEAS